MALNKTETPARRFNYLLELESISEKDIAHLNVDERKELSKVFSREANRLTGMKKHNFLSKIAAVLTPESKSEIWDYNHSLISNVISTGMRRNGVMPAYSVIMQETGLSRQTISKHLKDYKHNPDFNEQMEQFKFAAPTVLSNVFKSACNGDMRAARLYFEMTGALNKQTNNPPVNHQNNYIQINNTILSQENLTRLTADQINQIERIITQTTA